MSIIIRFTCKIIIKCKIALKCAIVIISSNT